MDDLLSYEELITFSTRVHTLKEGVKKEVYNHMIRDTLHAANLTLYLIIL